LPARFDNPLERNDHVRRHSGMDMRRWVFGLGVTTVMAGPLAARAAGAEPLLVVVEAAPGVDADAGEIRRAISAEVHLPTVAPTTADSEGAERALIVGVERNHIAVALRGAYAPPVLRVIPAQADQRARVRAIAWLAGNLVRDQVSGIVAGDVPASPGLANMPALAAPAAPAAQEAAVAPAATEPPPYQAPAATISAGSFFAPTAHPRWFLSLEAGAVVGYDVVRRDVPLPLSTLWRLELRRFSQDERFFLGVTAEGTTGTYNPEAFGAGGLCGWARRHGAWMLEGSVALGLDIGPRQSVPTAIITSTESSVNGFTSTSTVTYGDTGGGVYGGAAAAVSYAVGAAARVFVRVGAHLSTVEEWDWYVSSTLGVSYGVW
jgi:hypothetical protein